MTTTEIPVFFIPLRFMNLLFHLFQTSKTFTSKACLPRSPSPSSTLCKKYIHLLLPFFAKGELSLIAKGLKHSQHRARYRPTVDNKNSQRWNTLLARFQEQFGEAPAYIVRAPGRVNVLGEHIDYSLFVSSGLASLLWSCHLNGTRNLDLDGTKIGLRHRQL